ncbi:MAG: hypothetical protein WC777_02045 [Candidatus Gracilibacteria bacterium]|jgi:hypothetical protein
MKRFLVVPILLASMVLTPLASASSSGGDKPFDRHQKEEPSYMFWLHQPEAVELIAEAFDLDTDAVEAEFESGNTLRGMAEEYGIAKPEFKALTFDLKALHRAWIRAHTQYRM